MKRTIRWIPALYVLGSFILISHSSAQAVAEDDGNSGFISIDCGAGKNYVDELTGISYQIDEHFIESGTNNEVASSFRLKDRPYIQRQLNTLRSFPEGERNCYTLKLQQEIYQKQKYLIRAIFAYQNYDHKNQFPKFDVYLGVNFWTTIAENFAYVEVTIQEVTNDMVQVCLVDTGQGTPFINTLELRPLNKSLYSAPFPLSLYTRRDCGQRTKYGRYKDDTYDRLWRIYDDSRWDVLKTSAQVKVEDSTYELPSEILVTACQPQNNSNNLLTTEFSFDIPQQFYLFLHFSEIQKLPSGQKRIINVTFGDDDDNSLSQELTLEYLKPVTLISNNITTTNVSFTVRATDDSYAPPILNAFEIFKVFPQPSSPTDTQDVNAIMEIKRTYGISKISWQGDPCLPSKFTWEGVRCNSGKNTRIISLNLNSSKLRGQIAQAFKNLEKLESLDLSNNELTGELPEFLATLPNLKFLDVTGNKLTGSVPKALRENANLQLSVANNPGLCELDSCDKERKFVIPLVTSISVCVLIAILSLMIWRLRKKRQDSPTKSLKMEILKQKGREFSYSQVLRITDNFKTFIGEGGFGKVYLGTLEDDSRVAVKLLSPSSKQGYKEFQSEAQLLTVIHHRNLVSLVGFCHENSKALIYEYMDNGDLGQLLSEKRSNVLKWNERLQVGIDTAKGLEYLHTGCKTPIIHRDLKPSNILLDKSMVAKIADFGLSRKFTNEEDSHLSTQPAGTLGYIDPEFQRSGQLSAKSDIYSFGMILLQLITGRPPIKREPEDISFILDWIQPKIECGDIEGIVDPRFDGGFRVTSTWRAIEVAMSCVLPTPTQRPDISYILQELQECLALEMDHSKMDNTMTSSSHNSAVNSELITVVSAR